MLFSRGSSAGTNSVFERKTPPGDVMSDDKAQAIKCRGCGQVGTIAANPPDAFGGRQRRYGFYLHGTRDGIQVLACCKCQQIQPYESDVKAI